MRGLSKKSYVVCNNMITIDTNGPSYGYTYQTTTSKKYMLSLYDNNAEFTTLLNSENVHVSGIIEGKTNFCCKPNTVLLLNTPSNYNKLLTITIEYKDQSTPKILRYTNHPPALLLTSKISRVTLNYTDNTETPIVVKFSRSRFPDITYRTYFYVLPQETRNRYETTIGVFKINFTNIANNVEISMPDLQLYKGDKIIVYATNRRTSYQDVMRYGLITTVGATETSIDGEFIINNDATSIVFSTGYTEDDGYTTNYTPQEKTYGGITIVPVNYGQQEDPNANYKYYYNNCIDYLNSYRETFKILNALRITLPLFYRYSVGMHTPSTDEYRLNYAYLLSSPDETTFQTVEPPGGTPIYNIQANKLTGYKRYPADIIDIINRISDYKTYQGEYVETYYPSSNNNNDSGDNVSPMPYTGGGPIQV